MMKSKHIGIIALVMVVITLMSGCTEQTQSEQIVPKTHELDVSYEVLAEDRAIFNPNIENFYILVDNADVSEENMQRLADYLMKIKCKDECNIIFYDTEQAYARDAEYFDLSSSEEIEAWEEKNLIYVAEHQVAMKSFDSDTIWMYPLKD